MNTYWDKYYQKPLNEIPWQNTQADWFKELVDNGTIKGTNAIDLGCGTGKKSIYLAQKAGFEKVIGVDISKQAIQYAKQNAQENNVAEICNFISHDLTDWSFLPVNEKFDFVLDWALIHCLPLAKIKIYAQNIDKHCELGTKLLIRSFSSPDENKKYFEAEIDGVKEKIFMHSEEDLLEKFSNFKIIAKNISYPQRSHSVDGLFFIELLMEKYK